MNKFLPTIMRKSFLIKAVTLVAIVFPGNMHASTVSTIKKSMPDFCQADTRLGGLPENGAAYCGPVAVSNVLIWLSQNGFSNLISNSKGLSDQVELIKTLGGSDYMNTDLRTGTPPKRLMSGFEKFIRDNGYKTTIEYMGWRSNSSRVGKVPRLDWLFHKIDQNENVILDIGWYKIDQNVMTFKRIGGHYVTVVGRSDSDGTNYLYIHDPSKRSGLDKHTERCEIINLPNDYILKNQKGDTFSSKGYSSIQGIKIKKGSDLAIVDGVISFSINN